MHMKKILSLIFVISSSITFARSSFSSSHVQIDTDQQQVFIRIIDNTYEPFMKRNIKDQAFKNRLSTIRNTLVEYLNTSFTSDAVFFALEYLIHRIDMTLLTYVSIQPNAPSPIITTSTTVTQVNSENLAPPQWEVTTNTNSMTQTKDELPQETVTLENTVVAENNREAKIDIKKYSPWDKNILAWTTSAPIFKYELVAALEWIVIEDLTLATASPDFQQAISTVYLYSEDWELIGSTRPNGFIASFDNINRNIPTGQTDAYVVLETKKIWYNSNAPQKTSLSLNMEILKARGSISWKKISVEAVDNNESITIVPTIITHAHLTDQWENRSIDKRLFEWDQDLAILIIWNKVGENTSRSWRDLRTLVETIQIKIDTTFDNWDLADNLFISRTSSGNIVQWENTNGIVSFDMTQSGADNIINDQEEIVYIISWIVPTINGSTSESISIQLIDTDDWWIIYKTSDQLSESISKLNLKDSFAGKVTLSN